MSQKPFLAHNTVSQISSQIRYSDVGDYTYFSYSSTYYRYTMTYGTLVNIFKTNFIGKRIWNVSNFKLSSGYFQGGIWMEYTCTSNSTYKGYLYVVPVNIYYDSDGLITDITANSSYTDTTTLNLTFNTKNTSYLNTAGYTLYCGRTYLSYPDSTTQSLLEDNGYSKVITTESLSL